MVRVFLPEELREHITWCENGLSLFIRSNESLSGIASLFSYDFGFVAVDHRPVPSKIPNSGVILPLIYFCAEEL